MKPIVTYPNRLQPETATRFWRRPANVLIVDDDVDSVLLVERVFSQLGCETSYSFSSAEARQKICARKSDLIILDWCMDRQSDARAILDQCAKTFSRFDNGAARKLRVITYSNLTASEIELTATPYFEYLDHWQKPIAPQELLTKILPVLNAVEH